MRSPSIGKKKEVVFHLKKVEVVFHLDKVEVVFHLDSAELMFAVNSYFDTCRVGSCWVRLDDGNSDGAGA